MTVTEEERCKTGTPRQTIVEERIWNKRPDGLAIKMPTVQKVGEFVILKIQDDVRCERPICNSVKTVAIAQYESIKSVLEQTIDCQG